MTIQLACGCGRRYQIPDEHAGKKTKCKACGAVHVIPNPEPEEVFVGVVEEDTEVVDAIEVDDDETEVMTALEAEEAKPKRPAAREPEDDRDDKRGGKKRKRRPDKDEGGSLTSQYMAEARENMRRDDLPARGGRRGDDDKSWTIGGLHVTAGVLAGASMVLMGILAIVLIQCWPYLIGEPDAVPDVRLFIGAFVWTVLGGFTLIKSLFFGSED